MVALASDRYFLLCRWLLCTATMNKDIHDNCMFDFTKVMFIIILDRIVRSGGSLLACAVIIVRVGLLLGRVNISLGWAMIVLATAIDCRIAIFCHILYWT